MFECFFESFPVCMFKDLSGWRRNHDGVCGECKYHGEVIAECDIVCGDVVVQVCLCVSENQVWCGVAVVTYGCGCVWAEVEESVVGNE